MRQEDLRRFRAYGSRCIVWPDFGQNSGWTRALAAKENPQVNSPGNISLRIFEAKQATVVVVVVVAKLVSPFYHVQLQPWVLVRFQSALI